ncbi:MAG TPA: sigma-54 dependent transcriptional regulator [Candidatus Polarisedimenticolia bacterium]|jgi:DNA-binding NtrC family response regulator|nr:sigma-54 dependent transcriptional regulator [Candidatus Polarisedimenticolia bacterium]
MNTENLRILVMDPDEESGASISRSLGKAGYQVTAVLTLGRALALMARRDFDMVIAALGTAGRAAKDSLVRMRAANPTAAVLVLAPLSQVDSAVKALKDGAEDYLTKPLDPYELRSRVGRILERRELDDRLAQLQKALTQRYGLQSFVAESPAMKALVQRIAQVAPAASNVLILGESGVGKELVAKAIHFNSPRRSRPFLAINCAAIPEELIESELFGHERGAFTGAVGRAKGKFEIADGGTILLDEIGEMNLKTQVKLLRILEEREFMRLGGGRNIRVDVRVLAATNADLQEKLERGLFREDLYFRLKVITLSVPPLRDRRMDIPDLARMFMESLCRSNDVATKALSPEVILALQDHSWPGNVRELKNFLESLVVTVPGSRIDAEDLSSAFRTDRGAEETVPRIEAGVTLRQMEKELIRKTLGRMDGNRTRTARTLQIGVRTLQRKIKEYGLS